MAITNKEICERLECIENKMPNGELKEMHENIYTKIKRNY